MKTPFYETVGSFAPRGIRRVAGRSKVGQMKSWLVVMIAGSFVFPAVASANDGYWYGHPYENYYRYRGHSDSDSDDEAAWAIGGLVLGAIIGSRLSATGQASEQNSQPLPPPQKRKVVTCYDEVAYDESGKPYVARQCYENWK